MYFYSFDVFRAAGIQEHQLRYTALGTGLCELSTSVACVSPFSLISHVFISVLLHILSVISLTHPSIDVLFVLFMI